MSVLYPPPRKKQNPVAANFAVIRGSQAAHLAHPSIVMGGTTSRVVPVPLEWTEAGSLAPIAMVESTRDSSQSKRSIDAGSRWASESEVAGQSGGCLPHVCHPLLADDVPCTGVHLSPLFLSTAKCNAPRVSWEQVKLLDHLGSGEFCSVWGAHLTLDTRLGSVGEGKFYLFFFTFSKLFFQILKIFFFPRG